MYLGDDPNLTQSLNPKQDSADNQKASGSKIKEIVKEISGKTEDSRLFPATHLLIVTRYLIDINVCSYKPLTQVRQSPLLNNSLLN